MGYQLHASDATATPTDSTAFNVQGTPSVSLTVPSPSPQFENAGPYSFAVTVTGTGPTPTGNLTLNFNFQPGTGYTGTQFNISLSYSLVAADKGAHTFKISTAAPPPTAWDGISLGPGFNYTITLNYGGDSNYIAVNNAAPGHAVTWGKDEDGNTAGFGDDNDANDQAVDSWLFS
jgi:hypothetical protein